MYHSLFKNWFLCQWKIGFSYKEKRWFNLSEIIHYTYKVMIYNITCKCLKWTFSRIRIFEKMKNKNMVLKIFLENTIICRIAIFIFSVIFIWILKYFNLMKFSISWLTETLIQNLEIFYSKHSSRSNFVKLHFILYSVLSIWEGSFFLLITNR